MENIKKKIILAEDDSTFSMLLKFRLEEEGFLIFQIDDGLKVINLINKVSPDLFICDIMLPNISGLEIVEKIKQNKKYKFPILIISNANQGIISNKIMELGANDFLSKPFNLKELISKIKNLL